MNESLPETPFDSPDAWTGRDIRAQHGWSSSLTGNDIEALDSALNHAVRSAKPLAEMVASDFPLPALKARIATWLQEIDRGRGFLLLRGIPVERYTIAECERLYWGLGLHMGHAVSQNTDGALLGHVRDTGDDPAARGVRLYRTRAEQDFHTDGADVIGLFCLHGAKQGGVSRIVSSVAVANEIMRRAPELLPTLFQPFPFDRQGQEKTGEPGWFKFPVCRMINGRLSTFFIPWYIRESQALADSPRLSDVQMRCIELMETIANEPDMYLDMAFQ